MSPPDSANASNNVGTRENKADYANTQSGSDEVHSLGEALAGVSLGSASKPPAAAAAPAGYSAPFTLTSQKEGNTWGTTTTQSNFGNAEAAPSSFAATPQEGQATDSHIRNESLELFLSQSPSQTLGDDVFKLSHQNLPKLHVSEEEKRTDSSAAFRLPSGQSLAPGPRSHENRQRRTESPSCSVTGTTTSVRSVSPSRSVSPYTNNSDVAATASRSIPAYQRYDSAPPAAAAAASTEPLTRNHSSFAEDDRSSSGGYSLNHGHGSHPSLQTLESTGRSPYAKDRNQIKNMGSSSPYDYLVADQQRPQQNFSQPPDQSPAQPHVMNPGGQGQVLYMAVPSPDGRGQVLQPVQMLQLPGKPYTYVVPGAAGGLQGADASQAMMVLPPLANPGVNDHYQGLVNADARSPVMDNRSRSGNNYSMEGGRYGDQLGGAPPRYDDRSGGGGGGSGGQYQPDASVASLYAAPQRPPLDALLGQVRRLSRDQVGCRLVQQALDEEGAMTATLILNEGLPFWGEAMVDPFGNYLFQKILEKVTSEERIMLVRSVSTRLVNASLNLHGTRSVQKVVELCAMDELNGSNTGVEETAADILSKSLAPAAARLCIDSHGNHVIQRILLKLGHKHSKFVFDAVAASVGDVARHRHGCCVIQRCLDSPPSDARSHLVHRIVQKALELMQDAYGNYVVQYVLDVCADEDVQAVCESVVGKVNLLAIQKFSSNVMEKCLERCSDRVKECYMREMSDPERIRELMMDPFGNYVVQRALSVATHAQAVRLVEAMRPHLQATQTSGPNGQRNGGVRNTAGGRRIIAKICRRFPNFTLSPAGSQDELYSQNKGRHHAQPAVLAAYAVGAPAPPQAAPSPHHYGGDPFGVDPFGGDPFGADPRLAAPTHLPVQQQQSYYSIGGGPYYDQFNNGQGSYPGM